MACRKRSTPTAYSIVLSVEYGGRRVLLPADLASPGLDEVLAERPLHCDMLLVPHHGSRTSLPEQLSAWSTPNDPKFPYQDSLPYVWAMVGVGVAGILVWRFFVWVLGYGPFTPPHP